MASSFNLLDNPELDRILRINLPARRLLFIGGFALCIVLVIAGLSWNSYAGKSYYTPVQQVTYAARDTYWPLTIILFGLIFVLAPAMTALSFIQEKMRGTAIFQQMILMKPLDIALGKFFGSSAASYFAALIILPFALVAGLLADQRIDSVLNLYLFLIVGGLSFQAIGLFISAAIASPSEKSLRGGLLIGPAVGVFGAVTALFWYRYFTDHTGKSYYFWHFYGASVEGYVIILGLLIFIGLWAFAGAVRRIKASQLVPVGAWPVWFFFATAESLLVGILWGWQTSSRSDLYAYGTPPVMQLITYMMINWGALLALAGSLAVSRQGLREWWSAEGDPLVLFQREESRNSFKTFLIALGVSVLGLIALWISYHLDVGEFPQNISLHYLLPVVLGFVLTIAGMLCFVQYCAMQRFRARAWAGVGLVIAFYFVMGIAGLMFENKNNTAFLVNPAFFAHELTRKDNYMGRTSMRYNPFDEIKVDFYNFPNNARRDRGTSLVTRALLVEGLLALGCFGLAFLKWRKIEEEMLTEKATG
ncbi:MAG: hypothetical protein ICV60_01130 [Pyrinomonadaceae bacterium]|nr:hypothetical protein [Pyrinomonadaceae bacterium]